ncbi:MAG: hypothetical protein R3Y05_01320 [bacterium]
MADYDVGNIRIKSEVDSSGAVSGINNIVKQLKAVSKFESGATKAATSVDKISTKSETASINISKMFDISRIFVFYSYARRIFNTFSNMIELAASYEETMNKFQVSFGDLAEVNIASINDLANAFGFSTATLLDYTATFNNMLSALGTLDAEMSASISQTLTRMAIDYSSLFNVSLNSAMTAFQSVLAGSIRPIRETSGFDVSETSIYDVYLGLGGTKTMRGLDQVEKRLLRIIALQQQMMATGAEGDFARTIDSVANTIKIIEEQLKELGTWMGKVFLVEIKSVLHYFAAILTTATNVVKAFANLRETSDDIDYDTEFAGFESMNDDADNLLDTLTEIETTMLGFDKLNVLGDTDTSGAYSTDIDDVILDGLSNYEIYLDTIESTVKNISDSMMTWLGYTEEIREVTTETGEVYEETVWVLADGVSNISKIVDAIKAVAVILTGMKILTILKSVVGVIATIAGSIGALINPITIVVVAIASLVAYLVHLYQTNEEVAASLNAIFSTITSALETMFEAIKPSIESIMESMPVIIEALTKIVDAIIPVLLVLMQFAADIFAEIAVQYLPLIAEVIAKVVELVATILVALEPLIAAVLPLILKLIELILPVITLIVEKYLWLMIDYLEKVLFVIEFICQLFEGDLTKSITHVNSMFENLGNSIKSIFTGVWNYISDGLTSVMNFFISGINNIITLMNKMSIDIPEWLGGGTFGFNIAEIPQLASGGVLKENAIVNVAEYGGASTNPEIVAPQSILKETFMESMMPMVNALLSSNNGIKQAIEESGNRSIYMDSRKVGEELYDPLQQIAKVKGYSTTTK